MILRSNSCQCLPGKVVVSMAVDVVVAAADEVSAAGVEAVEERTEA